LTYVFATLYPHHITCLNVSQYFFASFLYFLKYNIANTQDKDYNIIEKKEGKP